MHPNGINIGRARQMPQQIEYPVCSTDAPTDEYPVCSTDIVPDCTVLWRTHSDYAMFQAITKGIACSLIKYVSIILDPIMVSKAVGKFKRASASLSCRPWIQRQMLMIPRCWCALQLWDILWIHQKIDWFAWQMFFMLRSGCIWIYIYPFRCHDSWLMSRKHAK